MTAASPPPRLRRDGASPLPLGMDACPRPAHWRGRHTVWPAEAEGHWAFCAMVLSWTAFPAARGGPGGTAVPTVVGVQSPEGASFARGILRRFSDFLKLHAALKRSLPGKKLRAPPSRNSLVRVSASPGLLEERRKALEDWLDELLSDVDISRSAPVASFLELEAAARAGAPPHTSSSPFPPPPRALPFKRALASLTASTDCLHALPPPGISTHGCASVHLGNLLAAMTALLEAVQPEVDVSGGPPSPLLGPAEAALLARSPQLMAAGNGGYVSDSTTGGRGTPSEGLSEAGDEEGGYEGERRGGTGEVGDAYLQGQASAEGLFADGVGATAAGTRLPEVAGQNGGGKIGGSDLRSHWRAASHDSLASDTSSVGGGGGSGSGGGELAPATALPQPMMKESGAAAVAAALAVAESRVRGLEAEVATVAARASAERERFTALQWELEEARGAAVAEMARAAAASAELSAALTGREAAEASAREDVRLLAREVLALRRALDGTRADMAGATSAAADAAAAVADFQAQREAERAALVDVLHEAGTLRRRLRECGLDAVACEASSGGASTNDTLALLSTSNGRITALLAEAQLLGAAQSSGSSVDGDDISVSDDGNRGSRDSAGSASGAPAAKEGETVTSVEQGCNEEGGAMAPSTRDAGTAGGLVAVLRVALSEVLVDNAQLRKAVNSLTRSVLATRDESSCGGTSENKDVTDGGRAVVQREVPAAPS
eukprot:SM000015S01282  [mRNA]  locus=s15:1062320:1065559:+ [translate_table: standard]